MTDPADRPLHRSRRRGIVSQLERLQAKGKVTAFHVAQGCRCDITVPGRAGEIHTTGSLSTYEALNMIRAKK